MAPGEHTLSFICNTAGIGGIEQKTFTTVIHVLDPAGDTAEIPLDETQGHESGIEPPRAEVLPPEGVQAA